MLNRSYTRIIFFSVCILAALCLSGIGICADQPAFLQLTVLHTNDIHGHLFPFDYDNGSGLKTDVGGAARRATLTRQMKAECPNPVLVMDAGDVFTRGPIADLHGEPDFEVMNAIPYDIMTLGNNEFKATSKIDSQQILLDRIKQARFPVVSANVYFKADNRRMVPPYKIFNFKGVRVGIFGLTAPRVAYYEQAKGLDVKDPITAAKEILPELREKCDFVIALTHIGYPADLQLAEAVPDIDVIIGGDSHTWLFQPTTMKSSTRKYGTIICQDGEWGRCIGRLDLSLKLAEDHTYRVENYSDKLVEVNPSITPARDIDAILQRATKPYLRKIGKLDKTISKQQAPAWVAECIRKTSGAQVGFEPAEAIENGFKAGNVTELDIKRMFPFINPLLKLTVNGKQLKSLVAAKPDAGLAGAEIRDGKLYIENKEIGNDDTITLAIENFYAGSFKEVAGAKSEPVEKTTRDAVAEYLTLGK